jgi:hypothetical protein
MSPRAGYAIVHVAMDPLSTLDFDVDSDFDLRPDETELVRAWRSEQLRRLGLSHLFADAFADVVDWHQLAALVRRGCPPMLALEIVR